MSTGVLGKWGV